jgi:hypothetical protein
MKFSSTLSVHLHKALLCGLCFLNSFLSYSQVIGGRGNGQAAPSEVKPADIAGSSYNGDVNLFTGTYNSSYDLGTVSTPSGLKFTVSLSYSSVFTSGNNVPVATGIPYGQGWSVNVPTISVSNDAYREYGLAEKCSYDEELVNSANVYETLPVSNDDGDSYWHSPFISIPGVAWKNRESRPLFPGINRPHQTWSN